MPFMHNSTPDSTSKTLELKKILESWFSVLTLHHNDVMPFALLAAVVAVVAVVSVVA